MQLPMPNMLASMPHSPFMVQQLRSWRKPPMGMSIGHSFGWGGGALVHCPSAFLTPQVPANMSAQQGAPVVPSTGPQMFGPQPMLPAGIADIVEPPVDEPPLDGGPLSFSFLPPPLPLVPLGLLSLPQPIGQRLANNVATASPRI